MKYIRTKDGKIFKVAISKEEYERDYKDSNVTYEEWFGCLCFSLDVIQQTDTIEELCDEFVCGKNHLLLKLHELKHEVFKEDVKDIVYGAIWTDKGLIYVAKMNEKGELELL